MRQVTLSLTKKEIKKFAKVFKDLSILDIEYIDILTINSIKKKLKTSYFILKQNSSQNIPIEFSTDEFRVLKILAMQYIKLKQQKIKSADFSEYKNEFDEYLNQQKEQ